MAAKLAVARALKTIAQEAGVHVAVRRFAVINQARGFTTIPIRAAVLIVSHCTSTQVGAIALGARLDCDAFADSHSSTAHYDPKSFVGMPVCLLSTYSNTFMFSFSYLMFSRLPCCVQWRPMSESICAEIYSTGKAK